MGKLDGKVAIITGGATGIGQATAKLFAAEGAKVVVTTSRNEAALLETVEEIVAAGGEALPVLADAGSEADWELVIEKTLERFGKINLLVNNAGRRPFGGVETGSVETLMEALKYDCFSVFIGMNRVLPAMRQVRAANEEAAIVNVTSMCGLAGAEGFLAYNAAKAAANAMTKSAAADLRDTGIRVNTVMPGLTETPLIKERTEEDLAGFVDQFVVRRKGKPEEIAAGILYLCSDDARWTTATELIIDGGFSGTRSYK